MPISDRDHRFIEKLIEQEKPQTLEDLQKLLNSLMGKPLPDHLSGEPSVFFGKKSALADKVFEAV